VEEVQCTCNGASDESDTEQGGGGSDVRSVTRATAEGRSREEHPEYRCHCVAASLHSASVHLLTTTAVGVVAGPGARGEGERAPHC
jgi:hypothetical protein